MKNLFKAAPDFWTSKLTWAAAGGTLALLGACLAEQRFPTSDELQTLALAWAAVFGRDGIVKAILAKKEPAA